MITAFLAERRPAIPSHSVCVECKRRGNVCVMVAHGTPCLGPVTHAGCGALCPAYDRGCYGCFGPMETPNTASLTAWMRGLGAETPDLIRALPHLQRRRARLPRGERARGGERPVERGHGGTRTIETDYLARVEGEGAMHVRLRGDEVQDVELRIYEPPRFFEALLRGRGARRGARHHGAHLRHLPGRLPDERLPGDRGRLGIDGRAASCATLRRLIYCGEWIESHALHVYMLHAPDFLGYESGDRDGRATTARSSSAGCARRRPATG